MIKILSFFLFLGILILPGCLFEQSSSVSPYKEISSPQPLVTVPEDNTEKANIIISSPKAGDVLSSPFEINGKARVFENAVNIDVKREDGSIVISEIAIVHANDVGEFGDFSLNLGFQFKETRNGTIEIYSLSPKDGSKENLIVIPVEFKVLDEK